MKARTDVLYSGFFCTEEIASRRRLPGRSPAAYNRMLRIAKALNSAGQHVELVSNGMSFRARIGECLIHRTEHGVADDIPFTVIPALGLPVIGFLVEPPIFLGWLLARFIRQRPRALIVYNATFASALGVALARLFGIRAVYEVEDLSSVSNALKSSGPERPSVLLQCINQTLSAVQLSLCDRLLVPSTDFLRVLGVSKRHLESALVVTGCMEPTVQAPRIEDAGSGRPLTVLFAGKLERAHGYGLLLDAIETIDHAPGVRERIEFHICGRSGHEAPHFKTKHVKVYYHGFLPDRSYRELLARTDIALALQLASGSRAELNTPSKAYEFLASGKLLIGTYVGDLAELYPEGAIGLRPETGAHLAAVLGDIVLNPQKYVETARQGLATALARYSLLETGRRLESLLA